MTAIRRWSLVSILLCVAVAAYAQEVRINLLQINDLYEISAVGGGKEGGMARLATIRNELASQNRHTYMVLAGDALSPSVIGTAVINGQPIAGAQMVAMLNSIGLDFATFGNHEFDLTEPQLQQRIRDSRFAWFSGNVRQANGEVFPGVRQNVVFTVEDDGGAQVRVGLIGVTLNQNKKPWVLYRDPIQTVREQVANMRSQGVNIVVAVTHQAFEDDARLAEQVPGIDLILGGHEHENVRAFRGPNFTPIFKADANVRSVYVHELVYDTAHGSLRINSRLIRITNSTEEDPAVTKVAKDWTDRAFAAFRQNGFAPEEVVANSPETLNGKESAVRNSATNLTEIIASAFLHSFPQADAAVFNSGSIRIDDDIPAGPIRQYDILRVLPFGGNTALAEMKGRLLSKVLDIGQSNRGIGGYLLTANISGSPGAWLLNGQPIDPSKSYRVATSDFLLSGGERKLEFLTHNNPEVLKVTPGKDMRFAVIQEFQKRWPKAQ
jgi:5'-nucleotidase / UDP-sugar diphosphatase